MTYVDFKNFNNLIAEFTNWQNKIAQNDKSIIGFPSGFEKLDKITNGFQPSNLVLISGAHGMGKKEFLVSLIRKMTIENHYSIVLFSLKMTAKQVIFQIVTQLTEINTEKLRSGLLNEDDKQLIRNCTIAIENSPLYINDYPFITVKDIEETLSCSPPDFPKIIAIDSLQSIALNKKDTVGKVLNKKELAEITYELKKVAEKYNIAIIVLCSLDFIKEKGNNYRPILSDLRKYAPVDTFADLVLFLYRPEYYKIDEWEDNEPSSTAGEAEIIVAKNNNGIIDSVKLKFDWKKGFFES